MDPKSPIESKHAILDALAWPDVAVDLDDDDICAAQDAAAEPHVPYLDFRAELGLE